MKASHIIVRIIFPQICLRTRLLASTLNPDLFNIKLISSVDASTANINSLYLTKDKKLTE